MINIWPGYSNSIRFGSYRERHCIKYNIYISSCIHIHIYIHIICTYINNIVYQKLPIKKCRFRFFPANKNYLFFLSSNLSRNTWSMVGNCFGAWKDRVREIYGMQRTDGLSSVPVRPFSPENSITFLYWWTDSAAEGAIYFIQRT